MENLVGESTLSIFRNRLFDDTITISVEMFAYPCFLNIVACLPNIRFVIHCIRDFVDTTHFGVTSYQRLTPVKWVGRHTTKR